MEKLNRKRQQAIKEALKQPENFENVLTILGYRIVSKESLKNLADAVKRAS